MSELCRRTHYARRVLSYPCCRTRDIVPVMYPCCLPVLSDHCFGTGGSAVGTGQWAAIPRYRSMAITELGGPSLPVSVVFIPVSVVVRPTLCAGRETRRQKERPIGDTCLPPAGRRLVPNNHSQSRPLKRCVPASEVVYPGL